MRRHYLPGAPARLSLRDLDPDDIASIHHYWKATAPDHLRRMGVEATRLPSLEALTSSYLEMLSTPDPEKNFCVLIWEIEERAVGFSSLKKIRFGHEADVHLHLWDAPSRGKGLGRWLFAHSVRHFLDRFELSLIACEPAAGNPVPNRVLSKLGVPIVRTYPVVASEICFEIEVNRHEMSRALVDQFCRNLEAASRPSK